jgi:hypothetical protein
MATRTNGFTKMLFILLFINSTLVSNEEAMLRSSLFREETGIRRPENVHDLLDNINSDLCIPNYSCLYKKTK